MEEPQEEALMPKSKKRELPESFRLNAERMKAGEIKRKTATKAKPKAKKTTRKQTKGRR